MRRPLASLLAFTLGLSACRGSDNTDTADRVVTFDTGSITIATKSDTIRVPVEFARSATEQQYGLMERTSLDAERGMLFAYDSVQDTTEGFWMFRTKIPLDIAFIDSAGAVVAIRSMEPCTSPQPAWCPSYSPGRRYQSALEANRGFFARHRITEGALVRRER